MLLFEDETDETDEELLLEEELLVENELVAVLLELMELLTLEFVAISELEIELAALLRTGAELFVGCGVTVLDDPPPPQACKSKMQGIKYKYFELTMPSP